MGKRKDVEVIVKKDENPQGGHSLGGIVKKRPDGWYLFDAEQYTEDLTAWRRFEF